VAATSTLSPGRNSAVRPAPNVFSFHVAFPPGRVHRAVPSDQTTKSPYGGQWLHEIKHDGFRMLVGATRR
jgi:ATP-dependent DNA ligase